MKPFPKLTSRILLRQLLKTIARFPIPSARSKLKYNVHHVFRLYQHETHPTRVHALHHQGQHVQRWLEQFQAWPQKELNEFFRAEVQPSSSLPGSKSKESGGKERKRVQEHTDPQETESEKEKRKS
ncbi:hypothetical protein HMI54_011714, partial [Coelomomyces lativittatus]